MTIVAMRRVTLCGLVDDKTAVLEGLQALGVMHLIPLNEPNPLAPADLAQRRRAETAFRHIATSPELRRPYPLATDFDMEEVIEQISENRSRLRRLTDRRDELQARIKVLEPWGDIAYPPLEDLAGQRLWFYALPVKEQPALDRLSLPWAVVGRDPTLLYLAVVSVEEPPADLLPVARTHSGSVPLSRLHAELEKTELAIDKAQAARSELTRWRLLLAANLAAAQDRDAVREVSGQTLDEGEIFALQGWVPEDGMEELERFAADRDLALVTEEPAAEDKPPTLMRSADERLSGGTDLTVFYTSPGYRTWDPSVVVFASFALFFAMILADAGYAALIGLVAFAYWRRMGQSAGGRRMRVLLAALAGTSFVYGVFAGSYFGVPPPGDSLLAALAVIDVTDFQAMMRASLAIGALHIAIALLAAAWIKRGSGKAAASLGWLGVIAGAALTWLGQGLWQQVGIVVLIVGLAAVFLGSASVRPVEKPTDWLLRVGDGLIAMTGVTKLFGDILSYLRLFALGLASASLAVTFNGMAADIETSQPGLGLLLAIVILLVGHSINLLIGIMGGVVHGLRLNYIEFFGWGIAEEGYPYRAFAKRGTPE